MEILNELLALKNFYVSTEVLAEGLSKEESSRMMDFQSLIINVENFKKYKFIDKNNRFTLKGKALLFHTEQIRALLQNEK